MLSSVVNTVNPVRQLLVSDAEEKCIPQAPSSSLSLIVTGASASSVSKAVPLNLILAIMRFTIAYFPSMKYVMLSLNLMTLPLGLMTYITKC